ncbi:2Fe-2S iron-sulfur cluster-binding protein [Pseudomonas sp. YH-1]|uniref:2Fe-2S iron-sulfur cluster-binding protein n=1 Tax=Pseudomonas sp. YH-1 TaxID=3384787 RepID=UPI003F7FDA29
MFPFLARSRPTRAQINEIDISVNPKETLLQAALREGIDFPHSCRVGGCATCKCRLLAGQVRELTETSYILTDDELHQGYILACQSVPRGEVKIAVDFERQKTLRRVRGKIVGQDKLTPDITRLVVQLEDRISYRTGQYAELALDALSNCSRAFSFATPAQPDAKVSFFIRRVPGGAFTSLVNDQLLLGEGLTLAGPLGEFHLRPSPAPLLLIAGGSGLAPLLAILRDAADRGVERPTTLLFGARREHDLYALDEIAAIAARWNGDFRFLPVLSEIAGDSSWDGARGLVTAHIPALLGLGTQAYLCGPPAMIDSATALLRSLGVDRSNIHADRFTTVRDSAATAAICQ